MKNCLISSQEEHTSTYNQKKKTLQIQRTTNPSHEFPQHIK